MERANPFAKEICFVTARNERINKVLDALAEVEVSEVEITRGFRTMYDGFTNQRSVIRFKKPDFDDRLVRREFLDEKFNEVYLALLIGGDRERSHP